MTHSQPPPPETSTASPEKISLCAIVKNEAHCIEGMLTSVADLVSELIIVDTGSTDSTTEIARAAGARVEPYAWTQDFAAARNFSLSLATTPWIMVLDADERLESNSISLIRELVKGPPCAFYVQRHHYTPTNEYPYATPLSESHPAYAVGARGFYVTKDVRLFPNDKRIAFSGAVHESPDDTIVRSSIELVSSDIIVHHYGNLAPREQRLQKAEFYLTLAERKASQAPDDWRSWYHLALEFQSLDRHAEAITNFERATQLMPHHAPVWRQLGISFCSIGDFIHGLTAIQRALELDDTCPITWTVLGAAFLELGHLHEAENCFRTILASAPTNTVALNGLKQVELRRAGQA